MKDYMKPSLRRNPDHFILHVDTNDLSTERSPELIAKPIVDLATMLKVILVMYVFQVLWSVPIRVI